MGAFDWSLWLSVLIVVNVLLIGVNAATYFFARQKVMELAAEAIRLRDQAHAAKNAAEEMTTAFGLIKKEIEPLKEATVLSLNDRRSGVDRRKD